MTVNSLKDEIRFLFSGQGMPYEKVCIMVATVIALVLGTMLSSNIAADAPVAVIDLDNSAYSHEMTNRINASEFMHVTAVINTPTDPQTLFYRDQAIAVVYFPPDLEKSRYTGEAANIGVFYDNAAAQGDPGSTNDSLRGTIGLADRNLFNPNGSNYNVEVQGFLFFFGSMFFTFATIGMIPRLRLTHQLDRILLEGTPWDLILRILPYGACLAVSFVVGMALLRVLGDMTFSGHLAAFLLIQAFYVMTVGMLSLLFGWTAANPGIASSRMILFIPGGFIFGGPTGPTAFYPDWVLNLSHVFPLTWEFHFTRDIILRGAGLADISKEIGAFLIYIGVVAVLFCVKFYRSKQQLQQRQVADQRREAEMQKLAAEAE